MPSKETIVFQERPSWLYFSGLILVSIGSLILVIKICESAMLTISLLSSMLAVFARFRRLYIITDMRIMMKIGLIANNTNEMEIRHIRGINVRQSVWERLLGIGTLEIISAADGGAEVVFQGVKDPSGVRDKIRRIKIVP